MKENYYAVSGAKGLGVFTSYEEAYSHKDKIGKFRCKKMHSYQEARDEAIDRYNSLQEVWDFEAFFDEQILSLNNLRLNHITFTKDIGKMNRKAGNINGIF